MLKYRDPGMNNSRSQKDKDKIMAAFNNARKKFELYEKFYLGLSQEAKKYLRHQSEQYKKILSDIQGIVLSAVQKNCSACSHCCCNLDAPQIPICESVGWFGHVDYLLARCATILPDPCYENAERNLCPFWSDGCTLPPDCRSYRCTEYFCHRLESEIDMQLVYKYKEKIQSVITGFSIGQCMG